MALTAPPPLPATRRLVYVTDPMCSWCWGFAPVLDQLTQSAFGGLPVSILLGGLRPGTTHAQTAGEKASQQQHWRNVQRASAQPFDFSFFDRPAFVYDTEPAARAVIVARRQGNDRAHQLLTAIQQAFYRDNQDVTDEDQLVELAVACGFETVPFAAELRAKAAHAETQEDFALVRRLGIAGFPTLLGQTVTANAEHEREVARTHGALSGRLTALVAGYQPWPAVESVIRRWLQQSPPHGTHS